MKLVIGITLLVVGASAPTKAQGEQDALTHHAELRATELRLAELRSLDAEIARHRRQKIAGFALIPTGAIATVGFSFGSAICAANRADGYECDSAGSIALPVLAGATFVAGLVLAIVGSKKHRRAKLRKQRLGTFRPTGTAMTLQF